VNKLIIVGDVLLLIVTQLHSQVSGGGGKNGGDEEHQVSHDVWGQQKCSPPLGTDDPRYATVV